MLSEIIEVNAIIAMVKNKLFSPKQSFENIATNTGPTVNGKILLISQFK
jgi:hypothetical protein